ncbi:MAG: cytochrome c biogenesis protein CcsA [Myxococcales bacterium]
MNQAYPEIVLHWVAVGFYLVAAAAFAHAVIFGHPQRLKWGQLAALAGLVPHSVALALRWTASGHGPYMMKYEVLSSNAWVAVVLLSLVVWRRPRWAALSVVAMPACVILVALGLFSNPAIRELPPSLRSVWLVFHISFAKLSTAAFLLSLGSAVLVLIAQRPNPRPWLSRLPSVEVLDALGLRFVGFGFLFWTVNTVAGAIWANESWGRYWGWDVIETWSLITWLVYGTFLHARLFFGLKGRRAAWASIGCFVVLVLTFLVLPYLLPSLHAAYFQ